MQAMHLAIALLFVTASLAVISGINDGGVLLALAVRYTVVPLRWFVVILCVMLIAGPLLLSVTVAKTLTFGLFAQQPGSELAFLVGAGLALIVVLTLSALSLPTSLTLALVGGLSGAAWGFGLTVKWPTVLAVLLIGAAAPIFSVIAGRITAELLRLWDYRRRGNIVFRALHLGAFSFQCLAYAVNDGQKMLAAAAVTLAALPAAPGIFGETDRMNLLLVLVCLTVLYCVGMLASLRKVTRRIAIGLAVLRPVDAVTAELVSATVVMASSALGAPVSMTQAVAGGIVGTASSKGMRRVRWDSVTKIAGAWLITLPASGLLAFGVARVIP
ncbi:MAG: inorganic phosphate transporter [Nakamurella sp.]